MKAWVIQIKAGKTPVYIGWDEDTKNLCKAALYWSAKEAKGNYLDETNIVVPVEVTVELSNPC